MNNQQRDKLRYLVSRHPGLIIGTMEDLIKIHEAWCLRIGVDDKWLDDLYERHMLAESL